MKLFLVPTPIGNLGDITLRALDVIRQADLLLCEDTRTSGKLLKHFDIQKKTWPYHQHNEHRVTAGIIDKLRTGASVALITDAGTPGISDPGFLLLRECLKQGIPVECLPGATAFVPALVQSGLPANRFVFEGFLPVKKGRKTRLELLAKESRTILLYESPHRLLRLLTELQEHFGATRQAAVCRELSKLHEETIRGSVEQLVAHFTAVPPRGEVVLVVEGAG